MAWPMIHRCGGDNRSLLDRAKTDRQLADDALTEECSRAVKAVEIGSPTAR